MKKCMFCGIANETVQPREGFMELCDVCNVTSRAMKAETETMEETIVEPENVVFEEMPEPAKEVVAEEEQPRCEIVVGVKQDGSIYFNAKGTDTNLLLIDGLVQFARRRMDEILTQKEPPRFAE